jgi:signal transduction histidine kinase
VAYADIGRIKQVVLNLMVNAAQVSEADGLIEVRGSPAGRDAYQILVSDRGPGIPPEDRSRIFEPFFSKRPGGSGLGLAVCQGIVRAHGGSIAAEDGKAARLPGDRPAVAAAGKAGAPTRRAQASAGSRGR